MVKNSFKILKLVVLTTTFPFIYGCGAGAGIGSLTGFLFGGGGGVSGSEISLLGSGGGIGGGAGLAAIHNPEPATMMLFGTGLIAMSYFKSKTGRK